jgi:glutaminyl-peptide cyclotransferase
VEVLARYPHPGRGFTQGLVVDGEWVWESTGRYGQSTLRCYRLGDTVPQWQGALGEELFGEGICLIDGSIWQLTWKEHLALRWCTQTCTVRETVALERIGWGACRMGEAVVTTDGSAELVIRDPRDLRPARTLSAHLPKLGGKPVRKLNDLAYASGRLWINRYCSPLIAGLDPHTGHVTDIIDATRLTRHHVRGWPTCLNGIAALPEPGQFLLTGKQWPVIYRVRFTSTPHDR